MKKLKLSNELSVPLDIVTEALAWIGARGSGKTHGAGKLVELLVGAEVPVVVLDPVGVWYGLRLAKDGKGVGLSIPVFGGLHGDVPLEPTAGALIADLIADRDLSAILDVSQFDTDSQKARFTADFAERLFQRKKKDPSVIHWVVDEAQEFVPQNPQPGEQMMLHRMQRVLKLGRNFGIGVSLLTQRPQETSKKALNQCQTVLAFRVTGPQERKAMRDWIAAHDLDQSLVEKLPSLETGTCHVWSPAFLKVNKEIRILPKETFDASATPKFGQRRATRALAPIDLEKVRADMAATIEKAKENDPAELKKKVAELTKKLAAQPVTIQAPVHVVPKRVEVPVLKDKQIKRLESLAGRFAKLSLELDDLGIVANEIGSTIFKAMAKSNAGTQTTFPPIAVPKDQQYQPTRSALVKFRSVPYDSGSLSSGTEGVISPARQRILDALAWLLTIKTHDADKSQLAFLADQSPTSSAYANNLGALRSAGLIDYASGKVRLTEDGHKRATALDEIRTSEDVQNRVMGKLQPARQRILKALIDCYPKQMTKEQVAEASGQSATSSAFANNLGALRSIGVLDYPERGMVVASSKLFIGEN